MPTEFNSGKDRTAVVILAAGLSTRMKVPKPFLPFDEQTVFIEKIVSAYATFGCGEIIAVVNAEAENALNRLRDTGEKARIVVNHHPEQGRFHSLKLGLDALRHAEFCFIQNVDNPFVRLETLEVLYRNRSDHHFVKPVYGGKGGHPVLISRTDMDFLQQQPDEDVSLRELLGQRKCFQAEVGDDAILININTAGDYEKRIKNR